MRYRGSMNHGGGGGSNSDGGVTDRLADELSPAWWQIETSFIFSLIKKHAHSHSSTETGAGGKSPPNWLHSIDCSWMSSTDSLRLKRNVISEFCHTWRPAGHPGRLILHKLQATFPVLNSYGSTDGPTLLTGKQKLIFNWHYLQKCSK